MSRSPRKVPQSAAPCRPLRPTLRMPWLAYIRAIPSASPPGPYPWIFVSCSNSSCFRKP
ncbi:Uncharacterised protein [Bordetella pertussis]|nr:Uncharacterised protein [Bordetella pertussis]